MSNITPNTSLEFYKNTGLSPNYENSLYFASSDARDNYFSALSSVTVPNCYYQRENIGFCRVQLPVAQLYQCDYMRFKNWNFENKWYYAFVLNVNYINNETTEVQYAVDYLMSWMGDFSFNRCYIERQHVRNDNIGANIAEEGLPVGSYVTEGTQNFLPITADNTFARVATAINAGGSGRAYGNLYSGLVNTDCESQAILNTTIRSLVSENRGDEIVAITMLPNECKGTYSSIGKDISVNKPYTSLNGYVPRNKKLFCYPYKYATIENTEGASMEIQYEYAGSLPDATSAPTMTVHTNICGYATGGEAELFIKNYRGSDRKEHRITFTSFPQCGWSTNSYEAYLAQKNAYLQQDLAIAEMNTGLSVQYGALRGLTGSIGETADNLGSSALSFRHTGMSRATMTNLGTAIATSAYNAGMGALEGLLSGMESEERTVKENMVLNDVRPVTPARAHGTPSIDLNFTTGFAGFVMYEKCITKNYALMLDSYFDMFGYAVRQHGTPNMNTRENWTYIKTLGCNISGAIPALDSKVIEKIFDKGIRFWKDLNNIGNYSLSNNPI